jgi:hypothetical protein
MRLSLRKLIRTALASAAVAAMVGGVGVAAASQSTQGESGTAAARATKRHHSGKSGRPSRGRRGPRGPQGPQGASGPAGPAGQGIQFGKSLATNVNPEIVFDQSGVRIEAGCSGGAVSLTVRSTAGDHNIIEVTSFDNLEGGQSRSVSAPNLEVNIPVDMLAGGSGLHDYNGLLAVRSLSGEVVTAQWFAMGSQFTPQGDCVVGGTVSP